MNFELSNFESTANCWDLAEYAEDAEDNRNSDLPSVFSARSARTPLFAVVVQFKIQ